MRAVGWVNPQPQVPLERLEIAVGVEQGDPGFDTPGGDQAVDGLAHGNAFPAQRPEIPGAGDGEGW